MSIWGRRVDAWFATRQRGFVNHVWQFGLIFLVTFVLMKVLGL